MSSTKSKRKHRGASFWKAHIRAQEKSGLRVREYCSRHGLSPSTFYDWRMRFSRESSGAFNLVSLPERLVVEDSQDVCGMTCQIRICIGRGYWIEVCEGFKESVLKSVISVLESM